MAEFDGDRKQLVYRGTSVTVYYQPDRRSIARCAVGPELTEAVTDLAENRAKPFAVGISPRQSGHYAKSFEVNLVYLAFGYPFLMTRVAAELANTDKGAAAIEWGKKSQPSGRFKTRTSRAQRGHHVLRQTLIMLDGIRGGTEVAAEAAHRAATGGEAEGSGNSRPSVPHGVTREQFRDIVGGLKDRGFL